MYMWGLLGCSHYEELPLTRNIIFVSLCEDTNWMKEMCPGPWIPVGSWNPSRILELFLSQQLSINGHGPWLNYLQYCQPLKQLNHFIPFCFTWLGSTGTLPFFVGKVRIASSDGYHWQHSCLFVSSPSPSLLGTPGRISDRVFSATLLCFIPANTNWLWEAHTQDNRNFIAPEL